MLRGVRYFWCGWVWTIVEIAVAGINITELHGEARLRLQLKHIVGIFGSLFQYLTSRDYSEQKCCPI